MSSRATTSSPIDKSVPRRKSSIHRSVAIPVKCDDCQILTNNDCGKCDKHCLCMYNYQK